MNLARSPLLISTRSACQSSRKNGRTQGTDHHSMPHGQLMADFCTEMNRLLLAIIAANTMDSKLATGPPGELAGTVMWNQRSESLASFFTRTPCCLQSDRCLPDLRLSMYGTEEHKLFHAVNYITDFDNNSSGVAPRNGPSLRM